MGRGGQIVFWIALTISVLGFLIATIASVYLLFALARGRIDQSSTAELFITIVIVLQPLLIGWGIIHAYRMRSSGSATSALGRFLLPILACVLIAVAVAGVLCVAPE